MENMLGLFRCGHYNEVALLQKWPLSEVSLCLCVIIRAHEELKCSTAIIVLDVLS